MACAADNAGAGALFSAYSVPMPASQSRGPVNRAAAADAIEAFLRALGLDPAAAELAGTGARVASAFDDDLCAGYGVDAVALLSASAVAGSTDLVFVRDIAVAVTCPHHLMPASGSCDVVFAPGAMLVGVGTIARIVTELGRRLVLQEALGEEIAGAIHEALAPRFSACRLRLSHACMIARGERAHGTRVETLAVRGAITGEGAAQLFGAREP